MAFPSAPGVTASGVVNAGSVGPTSTQLSFKNTARGYLLIQNQDPVAVVWVCFGTNNNATVNGGFAIPPGGTLELGTANTLQVIGSGQAPNAIPHGDVAAITNGPTVIVAILEK